MNYLSSGKLLTAEELAVYIEDTKALAQQNAHGFGAVIALDLSKRKVRARDCISCHSVSGDDLDDAIDNFMASDESSGICDADFTGIIMTVLYQAAF